MITKDILEKLIEKKFSTRKISDELNVGQTTIRYWLNKFDLSTDPSTDPKKQAEFVKHKCACGETNPKNFYGKKKQRCKSCHNNDNLVRGHRHRTIIIEEKGGKCQNCGFLEDYAMEFHHLNPNTKDENFSSHRNWSLTRLRKEMAGCVLLCSNCHRGVHANRITLTYFVKQPLW